MLSRIKNIYANFQSRKGGTVNNDSVSVSSAPGIIEEPIYDEIYDTAPPSEFEQVDNQCHFGILRYIVSYRFRRVMLIALVSLVVVLFIFVFFLVAHLDKKHDNVFVSSTLHNYLETTTSSTPTTSVRTTSVRTTSVRTTSAPTTSVRTTSALTTRTDTTPHTQSFPTTTNPSDRTDCSPNQNSTFFFAYSNDLTADQVWNTFMYFADNSKLYFETYALGRFDRVNNLDQRIESFVSSDSFNGIYDALSNGLPNSSESIKDPSEGSAVLDIIDLFFKSDVTHCGSTLFILTKRFPTDTSIFNQVSMLKKYHAHVTFVVSENSFGSSSSEPMYRLASETNGLCIFTEDDKIQKTPPWLPSIWPLYLVYSFNAEVTKSGSVTLPVFNSPLFGKYHICMTLQDHGIIETCYFAYNEIVGALEKFRMGQTTYIRKGPFTLNAVPYNMTLGFEYSDDKGSILQIRIYSVSAVDFWAPYNI
ncbi:hypothetical protein CRE_15640 [Caenorhabditis remanei]|uniref:DUF7154 domain-containing protein n=1 Tax=Caenorhabditis remanei TaxID=31234 RepID=E3N836_CAERE|nr:hypothetical protein CRE_15640 [Caenorhabditis remanei]